MRKGIIKKRQKPFSPSAKLIKGLALIAACCLLVRVAAGITDSTLSSKDTAIKGLLELSTGTHEEPSVPLPLLALLSQSSLLRQQSGEILNSVTDTDEDAETPEGFLYYHPKSEPEDSLNTVPPSVTSKYTLADYPLDASLIKIKNNPGLDFDAATLLSEELELTITESSPSVLIVHTHASEAYTPDREDIYTESDPYRTEDRQYNVVALGALLKEELTDRGINVIHDTGIYDYPSYAGSYSRTCEAIEGWLDKYPSISMVIDLHRDASEVNGSLSYKTTAEVGGKTCSQVMLVVGSNASGLEHPEWKENLKLALNLQCALESRYPGLARPISISKYRYNQHATTGSLILEVGYCGNTLQEAKNAIPLFADAAADVILGITQGNDR